MIQTKPKCSSKSAKITIPSSKNLRNMVIKSCSCNVNACVILYTVTYTVFQPQVKKFSITLVSQAWFCYTLITQRPHNLQDVMSSTGQTLGVGGTSLTKYLQTKLRNQKIGPHGLNWAVTPHRYIDRSVKQYLSFQDIIHMMYSVWTHNP